MSEVQDPDQPQRDLVSELVFLYLEELQSGVVKNYEEFAQRHNSTSEAVERRILALERAGLLGGEATAGFPEQLGDFRLLERLGDGGMGVVYAAEEISLGRRVALKLIRPEQVFFPQAKERFRREVEAVAKLSHPGIVQIFSFAEEGGVPYFAMELVEGASLGDVLRAFAGRAPTSLTAADLAGAVSAQCGSECAKAPLFEGNWVRACLEIARQIAVALEHAHARGVVHRDIKPSNVMITPDGRARLLDFGLASRAGASRLTRTGAQLGSLPYMPPEMVGGRTEDAGPRADVYSLGATLHESLALSLPFQGDSTVVLAQRITAGERESVRRRNPDVSIDVDTICAVAMELDPTRRYASAAALASDLVNVLERRPIAARRTGPWIRAQRWTERNPAGAAALALGALVLIGGPLGYGVLEAGAAEKERGLNTELRSANQTVALTNKNLETAKGEVEKKNSDLASSLQREKEQTARAERNLKTALEAIEKMLVTVGAEDLREIPRFGPVRIELLERARKFYLGLAQQDPESVDVQRELARITRSLGDVYEDLGRSPEALAEYTKAVELSSAVIAIDPDSINTRHMYASNLMQLALMRHQTGDMEQARSAYLEVLPIVEKLCLEDPKNTRFSHDLASSLLNLGGIEMAAGSADEALMHRGRAVEVMRQALAKEPGNAELVSHLTKCLNGLSNCEQGPGASERSRADLLEAWNLISGHLAGHPDARDIRFDLIEVSVNYGLSLVTSDAEGAERVLSKGFETGKRLVLDFPEDFTARNALVAVATNLGYHLTNQSRWAEALEPLNDAVEQGEALVSHESERVDSRCSLATALGCRSTALVGLHRIDEARADATRGVEIFDKVRQSLPSHPMVVAGSASCIMQRAEVERASGDWHKALESTDAAIELGASRSDISFQAFETYWHIAQAARVDPALAGEERTRTLSVLESQALDQLESTIEQGFEDLKRLETHADYAGLRSEPRFQSLVSELASRSK